MSKRAPVRTWVIAAVSLWALTGLPPDRTAQAASPSAPVMEQVGDHAQAPVSHARSASDFQRQGDPDDLLQGGNNPAQPGPGTGSTTSGSHTVWQWLVEILNSYLAAFRR